MDTSRTWNWHINQPARVSPPPPYEAVEQRVEFTHPLLRAMKMGKKLTPSEEFALACQCDLMEYRQQMVGSNDSYGLDGIPTPQRLNQQKELTPNSMQMMCPSCNSLVYSKIRAEQNWLSVVTKFADKATMAAGQVLITVLLLTLLDWSWNAGLVPSSASRRALLLVLFSLMALVYIVRKATIHLEFPNVTHLCPNCNATLAYFRFFWDSTIGTVQGNVGGRIETQSQINVFGSSRHDIKHGLGLNFGMEPESGYARSDTIDVNTNVGTL